MFKTLIVATLMLISSVSLAGELTVGSRLALKEDYKITKTNRNDYVLLNDVEVFLYPCKVYVLVEPSESFTTGLRRVYVPEYSKNLAYYKSYGWKVETVIENTSAYSIMPNFYSGKVFVVEKVNKSGIRVIDRSGIRYVFLLPKNIDNTFNVMD